ncbi:hypothetical protein KCU71_g134, partial [Aureobasidium melanogenum]
LVRSGEKGGVGWFSTGVGTQLSHVISFKPYRKTPRYNAARNFTALRQQSNLSFLKRSKMKQSCRISISGHQSNLNMSNFHFFVVASTSNCGD